MLGQGKHSRSPLLRPRSRALAPISSACWIIPLPTQIDNALAPSRSEPTFLPPFLQNLAHRIQCRLGVHARSHPIEIFLTVASERTVCSVVEPLFSRRLRKRCGAPPASETVLDLRQGSGWRECTITGAQSCLQHSWLVKSRERRRYSKYLGR